MGRGAGKAGTTRDQASRALFWHVKDLLDAVDFGIVAMEQAFLPHMIGAGGATMWEQVEGEIAKVLSGEVSMPALIGGTHGD